MEAGWLIEKGSPASPEYLEITDTKVTWTLEHGKATRFAREIDASAYANFHIRGVLAVDDFRICEHAWV